MAEFDDKLSAILNDQNAMGQIMALAQSLAGAGPERSGDGADGPGDEGEYGMEDQDGSGCGLSDFAPGRDARLLAALRPYLRPERQKKMDKMLEILQLLRLMRGASGK